MLIIQLVIAVDYGSSLIVAKSGDPEEQGDGTHVYVENQASRVVSDQAYASKLEIGKRVPSVKVLNQSDAQPSHFQELLKSNGCWRVAIFPGDIGRARQKDRLNKLGEQLASVDSFLKRFTPTGARYDEVIEVLVVHAAPRSSVTVFDFPEVFRPHDEADGWDYWKIFVDDESYHEGHGQIYEYFGIDPAEGCSIIIRPDQYLSFVGPMDAYDEMDHFFSAFMVPQRNGESQLGKTNRAAIVV
jgi:phenol 2-monooxygenase